MRRADSGGDPALGDAPGMAAAGTAGRVGRSAGGRHHRGRRWPPARTCTRRPTPDFRASDCRAFHSRAPNPEPLAPEAAPRPTPGAGNSRALDTRAPCGHPPREPTRGTRRGRRPSRGRPTLDIRLASADAGHPTAQDADARTRSAAPTRDTRRPRRPLPHSNRPCARVAERPARAFGALAPPTGRPTGAGAPTTGSRRAGSWAWWPRRPVTAAVGGSAGVADVRRRSAVRRSGRDHGAVDRGRVLDGRRSGHPTRCRRRRGSLGRSATRRRLRATDPPTPRPTRACRRPRRHRTCRPRTRRLGDRRRDAAGSTSPAPAGEGVPGSGPTSHPGGSSTRSSESADGRGGGARS